MNTTVYDVYLSVVRRHNQSVVENDDIFRPGLAQAAYAILNCLRDTDGLVSVGMLVAAADEEIMSSADYDGRPLVGGIYLPN